nr:glycerophosphodiester phosphodiesterase family protein [uncultured Bifidobacterium sp.]
MAGGAAVWAIAPRLPENRGRQGVPEVPQAWYAHRGLHDAGSGLTPRYASGSAEYVALARRMAMQAGYGAAADDDDAPIAPENSLAAFAGACEAGYGIELDLQLTADDQVVVVHDPDLRRVAADPRRVADLTYDELSAIPLFPGPSVFGDAVASSHDRALSTTGRAVATGTLQHVPLFSDVLALVAGRVPLIVEYKFTDNTRWSDRCELLMQKGDALLRAYEGPYVVESFHPKAMGWYRRHRPEVNRGQLSCRGDLRREGISVWAAGLLAFDWVSRPDFIAYDWVGGNDPSVVLARRLGATTVSWTVRSPEELATCASWFDRHIIEAFVPPQE